MSAISAISAISTTVNDVASILEGIQRIASVLKSERSVVVIVENYTKRKLTRIWDHHTNGGFAVTPSTIIDAKGVNIYGSQNKAMAIGTGPEGGVIYQLEGDETLKLGFYIYWNNPFIGNNKCTAFMCTLIPGPAGLPPTFLPYFDDTFTVNSTCGVGDKEVEMRFELLKNE